MKPLAWGILAVILLASVLGAASVRQLEPFTNPPITSYKVQPLDTTNHEIDRAAAAGEAWTRDPVLLGLHEFAGGAETSEERSDLTVHWKGRPAESPTRGELVIVEQGGADDSVAGEWERFELVQLPSKVWHVTTHYTATRCWRGADAGKWIKGACE